MPKRKSERSLFTTEDALKRGCKGSETPTLRVDQSVVIPENIEVNNLGVFALVKFYKGDFITSYDGPHFTANEIVGLTFEERCYTATTGRGASAIYVMGFPYHELAKGDGLGPIINDGRKGHNNCELVLVGNRYFFKALTTILPGTELTFSYGYHYWFCFNKHLIESK